MPHVIVIAGPNGAGKSTSASKILKEMLGVTEFVNADTIAEGLSAFNPEGAAFEAGRIMLQRLHALADEQRDFAFETTLATRSYAHWLKILKEQGYTGRRYQAGLRNLFHMYRQLADSWYMFDNSAPGLPVLVASCDPVAGLVKEDWPEWTCIAEGIL